MKVQILNFKFQKLTAAWVMPLLFLFVVFCGCSKKNVPVDKAAAEKTDMRIVSMAPNLTEILFALGFDEEIVGVTRHCTWPEKAKSKTCIGTFWQPDIEAVLACRPTVVLTLGFEQQLSLARRLEKIGCQTLMVNIESVSGLYQGIQTIGDKLQKSQQAEKIITRIKAKQDTLSARYAQAEKKKVLWIVQREPLRVAGTQTYVNELIGIAGGVNAIGDTLNVYPPISAEEFIGCMPDVIIEPSMDTEQIQEQKASAPSFYQRFSMTPAVRDKQIYIIDGDLVSRLSPRLDEGMQLVADCIWPESTQ